MNDPDWTTEQVKSLIPTSFMHPDEFDAWYTVARQDARAETLREAAANIREPRNGGGDMPTRETIARRLDQWAERLSPGARSGGPVDGPPREVPADNSQIMPKPKENTDVE